MRSVFSPLSLSLGLSFGIVVFAIATYPLYPRMYLSPLVEQYPALSDLFMRLYSTPVAHQTVDATGGNSFFYMYVVAAVSLFGVYLAALRYARRTDPRPEHLRWAVGSAALACLLFVFTPTLFTSDLYSYAIYGRIAAAYGGNPLITPPNRFPFDPIFPLLYWRDTVSVYGPLWISLSSLLMAAVPPLVSQQVAVFKVAAVIFHLANGTLIWRILERTSPGSRLFGTVLYLWNPLLLVEFAANGHNDVVMIFLVLASLLSMVHLHRLRPLAFLAGAILTKWIAVLLLPIYMVVVLRGERSWRLRATFLATGGATVGLVAVVLYWPYWAGLPTITDMFNSAAAERFLNSPAELLTKPAIGMLQTLPYVGSLITGRTAGLIVRLGLGAVFAGIWLAELIRVRRLKDVAPSWLRVTLAYLIVACFWFWPWYVTWLVPLVALSGWNRAAKTALIFTFTSFLFYATWPGAPLRPFEPYYDLRALALFAPPLLYLAVSMVLRRRRALLPPEEKPIGEAA